MNKRLLGRLLACFGCEEFFRGLWYKVFHNQIYRRLTIGPFSARFNCPSPTIADYIASPEDNEASAILRIINHIHNDSIVWDIGANMGLWTMFMAQKASPSGCVFAFEPIPATFELLQKNIKANSLVNVKAQRVALGDKNAMVEMFPARPDDGTTSSLAKIDGRYGTSDRATSVVMLTAKSFATEHGLVPDVAKIDVEGAECLVLRGFSEDIWASLRTLSIEIHPEFIPMIGGSVSEVEKLIRDKDFSIIERTQRRNTEHWFCTKR